MQNIIDGLVPVHGTVSGKPVFSESDVEAALVKLLVSGSYFKHCKSVDEKIDDYRLSQALLTRAADAFKESHEKFLNTTDKIASESKKASGTIRGSSESVSVSMNKLFTTVSASKLEAHVRLLERAAAAMRELAEIESSGKLSKLIGALK